MRKNNHTTCKIYVACLAAYNNGYLHGAWIDANLGEDVIWNGIKEVLASSPIPEAEEWAIHDYEGFEGLYLSEYEGIDSVCEKAEFIEEHGQLGAELASHFGGDINEARTALSDQYAGAYRSLAEFAEELTEDTTEIPDNLQYYIDYERMGRDFELNGDVFVIELSFDDVHIFWSR